MSERPPANWYSDPTQRHEYRYWDGAKWTDHVSDQGKVSSDPPHSKMAETSRLISPKLILNLDHVGRTVFTGGGAYIDVSEYYLSGFLAAGTPTDDPAWSVFVERFVGELNEAARAQGGWASAGAFHVAKDFVKSDDWSKGSLVELMDLALKFLMSAGVDGSRIPLFAIPRWNQIRSAGA